MPLASGTTLGAYEIIAALGAGGMGEVYRARDTRLGRDVALKVLPVSRHEDAESGARFDREARMLASLNNPYIAAIHDVIKVEDHRAIVMELVDGPTLAEVIGRGPVPLRLAIGYGIDISEALSVAHAAGIVHRDLKPANVVITESGSAKVLDFGIAKLGATNDPSATDFTTIGLVTAEHAIVGTPAYLSPEQANGRPVDARSDIFSLGAVLHEMISGQRAFHGDSTAAFLSAVLRDDPPLLRTILPTPRSVERLVARCLAKDPRRRYQNAADVKAILEDIREDLSLPAVAVVGADSAAAAPAPKRRELRALTYGVAAIAGLAGFVLADALRPPLVSSPTYRPLITEAVEVDAPAWSPDGRTLAYVGAVGGQPQVFLRSIDADRSTQLTKQGTNGISMFWSPDGSRIYFTRADDGNLVSVSTGGGEPQLVTGATLEGGSGQTSRLPGGLKACISPDGRTIVFPRADPGGVRLSAMDVGTGAKRALDPTGLTQPLANVQALAFSPDGTRLAMIGSATALNDARGVWLISWPEGSARQLFADAPYFASNPAISWMPDSRRFVMNGYPIHGGTSRLLMAGIGAGTMTELTGGKDDEGSPSVTPNGRRIAFVSHRSGLDLIRFAVAGGSPEPLLATSRSESQPDMSASGMLAYVTDAEGTPEVRVQSGIDAWPRTIGGARGAAQDRATQPQKLRLSRDGHRVAVEQIESEHLIYVYPTAGGTPVRIDAETTDQHGPSWSPDGNWIAYRRLRNGSWELVKAPLGGGSIVRLEDANPGGAATDWSGTGQWIAHWRNDGLHLVSPDGASKRVLAGFGPGPFRFAHDGSQIVAVKRGVNRGWELATWDVGSGRELRAIPLPLSSTANVQGLALTPDNAHIIVGAGTATSDIWSLEQFEPPPLRWTGWLRR